LMIGTYHHHLFDGGLRAVPVAPKIDRICDETERFVPWVGFRFPLVERLAGPVADEDLIAPCWMVDCVERRCLTGDDSFE